MNTSRIRCLCDNNVKASPTVSCRQKPRNFLDFRTILIEIIVSNLLLNLAFTSDLHNCFTYLRIRLRHKLLQLVSHLVKSGGDGSQNCFTTPALNTDG